MVGDLTRCDRHGRPRPRRRHRRPIRTRGSAGGPISVHSASRRSGRRDRSAARLLAETRAAHDLCRRWSGLMTESTLRSWHGDVDGARDGGDVPRGRRGARRLLRGRCNANIVAWRIWPPATSRRRGRAAEAAPGLADQPGPRGTQQGVYFAQWPAGGEVADGDRVADDAVASKGWWLAVALTTRARVTVAAG